MKQGLFIALLFLYLVLHVSAQDEADFSPISTDVPQTATGINVSPSCEGSDKVPNTIFTIEPSDSDMISVATNPADLVVVSISSGGDMLEFSFNPDVAGNADEGGVIVKFPIDKLNQVHVEASNRVQVLDGFTNLMSLTAQSSSFLQVSATTLNADLESIGVTVKSSATCTMKSNLPITDLDLSSSGSLTVEADLIGNGNRIESSAILKMKGNIDGEVNMKASGKATINGNILPGSEVEVSSSSELSVGDISGNVKAVSSGMVTASGCVNAQTESSGECREGQVGTVTVDVEPLSLTRQGSFTCTMSSASSRHLGLSGVVTSLILASTVLLDILFS